MSYKEILEPEVDASLINKVDEDRIQSEFVPAQGIELINLNFWMIFVSNLNFL